MKAQQRPRQRRLVEPYTVLIDERPIVVKASNHEEAIKLAKAQVEPADQAITTEKAGDGE